MMATIYVKACIVVVKVFKLERRPSDVEKPRVEVLVLAVLASPSEAA